MKIKDFLAMMETPLNSVDIDLYIGDDCEGSLTMSADEFMKSEENNNEYI